MGGMGEGMLQQNPRQFETANRAHRRIRVREELMETIENLYDIRQQPGLTRIMREGPEKETWINQDYKEKDIDREIRHLERRKAHGNGGIPGEAYEATRKWEIKPITEIMNLIKNWGPILERWEDGTVVYKNKGDAGECENYRPICLTQIIYKIWSGLITRN